MIEGAKCRWKKQWRCRQAGAVGQVSVSGGAAGAITSLNEPCSLA